MRKYVVMRKIEKKVKKGDAEEDRTFYTAPKIQRLITEKRLRRKRLNKKIKKDRWAATKDAHIAYEKLLSKFLKEKKAAYKESHKVEEKKPAAPAKTPAKAPAKAPAAKTPAKPPKVEEKKPAAPAKAATKTTKGKK